MSLHGKRIVIIGGTSGFGYATALAAAQEGARIVVASSTRDRVDRAVRSLPAGAEGFVVDLTSEDRVQEFFDTVGVYDHLVVTAADKLQFSALSTLSLDDARRFLDIRFWGALLAARHGSRCIATDGSMVLTSGIVGRRPLKGWAITASLTGAMEALTRALAVELAPVRVNAVCAGMVRSPLWDNMPEAEREAMYTSVGNGLPVGRVGEVGDLAEAYLYLMRERFATGSVIVVDGGALIA
jgi:NAD(P)-dependent dehydrogenase (short-subunit alcohol dehydrogenase family)